MFKKLVFYTLKLLLQCIVLSIIFYFVSLYLVDNSRFSKNPFAIMQGIGITTVLFGAMGFTRGTPNAFGSQNNGFNTSAPMNFLNSEATQYERRLFPYHEIFHKNNIAKMDFGALSIVIIGLFTFFVGFLIDRM